MVISSSKAPAAIGPYSQAVSVASAKLVFISGQLPVDRETGEFAGTDVAAQTRQAILNLQHIVREAGGELSNIKKTTVFLKDMNDFTAMNEVYAELFTGEYPARSTVEVARLPKDARVEIEAIAVID